VRGRNYAAINASAGQARFSCASVGWTGTSDKRDEAMGAPTRMQPGGSIFMPLDSAIADSSLRSPGSFACSGQNYFWAVIECK